jgi:nucleoside phosphorylase
MSFCSTALVNKLSSAEIRVDSAGNVANDSSAPGGEGLTDRARDHVPQTLGNKSGPSQHPVAIPALETQELYKKNLGNLYSDQGRLQEAEAMYQRALQGKEKALGQDRTSTLGTANNLGSMNPKRTYQDEEPSGSLPKRSRTFDIASNDGIYPNHDAHSPLVHGDYTIAWICALPLELAASRAMLDEEHPLPPNQAGDDNNYVLGRIDQHNVVMACLPGQYGTNNAAIVATNLKRSFPNIRATLMVGIGGGSPSQADLYLGDVVVGTRVMQYDMGKMVAGGLFQGTADAKTPAWLLNSAVSALRSKHGPHRFSSRMTSLLRSRLSNILRPSHPDHLFQASYEHHPLGAPTCSGCDLEKLQPRAARSSDEPWIHYGVVASGNSVMKDGKARDDIAQRLSALCFEMEAAGMMDNLQCLPIRGICDYSDSHKNKEWQDYAAATAAAYARELLEGLPPSSRTLDQTPTYITNASQPDTAGNTNHCPSPSVLLWYHADWGCE